MNQVWVNHAKSMHSIYWTNEKLLFFWNTRQVLALELVSDAILTIYCCDLNLQTTLSFTNLIVAGVAIITGSQFVSRLNLLRTDFRIAGIRHT